MRFDPKEIDICAGLFNKGSNTSEVQEYLMHKYNCLRCKTSNFIKYVRKYIGIYNSKNNKLIEPG